MPFAEGTAGDVYSCVPKKSGLNPKKLCTDTLLCTHTRIVKLNPATAPCTAAARPLLCWYSCI